MKVINLFVLMLIFSCASDNVEAWVEDAPIFEEQTWRICTEEKDGAEKHLNGFCYISRECKKRRFRRRICRPLPKYIPHTDKIGVQKLVSSGKVLARPED